jgi:UDP-N-acetylglucosamine acyltransferase
LSIHPTAIVSDDAVVSPDAEIGPFCVISGRVEIGAHTVIDAHARIGSRFGRVVIGEHNHIEGGASLGGPPQDLAYKGGDTTLVVGDGNRIGEYAQINLGSEKGGGVTRIGSHTFIMAYVHVAHDCQIGDHVIIVNATQLAGHAVVEHHAVLSGFGGLSQFVRVGAYCFLVGGAVANKDIPPYTIAEGHWATPRALNRVGLKRAGFDASERRNLDNAVRFVLDRSLTIEEAVARIREECTPSPQIEHFVHFLTTSQRGIARG